MDKRYQVFVSSTYEDLVEERKSVSQALLESGCIPAGMELFPASNKESWEIIKKVIKESDYYLLIIAGRYGSMGIDDNGKKVGYTEMEYEYAKSIDKPAIVFINEDTDKMIASKVEPTKRGKSRLSKFKAKIKDSHTNIAFWKDRGELISKIKTSIAALIEEEPAFGWIRGNETIEDGNIVSMLENWKIEKIFRARAEKNIESDPKLEKHNIERIDGIAFGLSSFRSTRENDVLRCLQCGTNIRFLVMNPDSEFARQRAVEEGEHPDSISLSIKKLVEWADRLNGKSDAGKITVKYYNAMTLDFYWRMDDELYTGPYMYNIASQQTITYKFIKGGKGFELYTNYFESLWNDDTLCKYPGNYKYKTEGIGE